MNAKGFSFLGAIFFFLALSILAAYSGYKQNTEPISQKEMPISESVPVLPKSGPLEETGCGSTNTAYGAGGGDNPILNVAVIDAGSRWALGTVQSSENIEWRATAGKIEGNIFSAPTTAVPYSIVTIEGVNRQTLECLISCVFFIENLPKTGEELPIPIVTRRPLGEDTIWIQPNGRRQVYINDGLPDGPIMRLIESGETKTIRPEAFTGEVVGLGLGDMPGSAPVSYCVEIQPFQQDGRTVFFIPSRDADFGLNESTLYIYYPDGGGDADPRPPKRGRVGPFNPPPRGGCVGTTIVKGRINVTATPGQFINLGNATVYVSSGLAISLAKILNISVKAGWQTVTNLQSQAVFWKATLIWDYWVCKNRHWEYVRSVISVSHALGFKSIPRFYSTTQGYPLDGGAIGWSPWAVRDYP